MRKIRRVALAVIWILWMQSSVQAQVQPGFSRQEYADMLWMQFKGLAPQLPDSGNEVSLSSGKYQRLLLSPEVGLYNRCAVYLRQDGVVVLQLRGTVNNMESWLENFYAGMVPATGSLQLSADYRFDYQLASHPQATVHVGWLIGTGFLARSFTPVLDSLLAKGHQQWIVSGHSQGGALSYLVSSYLFYKYKGQHPQLRIKTYASAAPKPGNQYYAYDFEHHIGHQWGFRIVNSDDWVPETPVSLQTVTDYNAVNPLTTARTTIRKQKLLTRIFLNTVYGKLERKSRKSAAKFRKYLGDKLYKFVAKSLPGYQRPVLAGSMHYATAGTPVVLMTNSAYKQRFAFDGKNYFVHHMLEPYLFLLDLYHPAAP